MKRERSGIFTFSTPQEKPAVKASIEDASANRRASKIGIATISIPFPPMQPEMQSDLLAFMAEAKFECIGSPPIGRH